MSGKFLYPYVAWDTATHTARFVGMFPNKQDAANATELNVTERIVQKIELDYETADHVFALIRDAWQPDEPNQAQTTLLLRALKEDEQKTYVAVAEINAVPQSEIQTSRWAMLYAMLDRLFPKRSKPIDGWEVA